MNSYERVMAAMELKQPDRVPILEILIDPKVYKALLPTAKSQADFEEHFGFDAVCCGANFEIAGRNTDGSYFDEWGVLYKPTLETVAHPIKGPIETIEDLETYTPPDPKTPNRLGRLPELVAKYKGSKAIVFHQRAAFMWSAYLMGIDNLLMNFLAQPQLVHQVMDMVLEVNVKIARNAIKMGADIITLGDDYADKRGPMFSPAVFKEFILPRLKRMVDAIHKEGAKVIKHTDGNIWKILSQIVGTGIDGLNPIEPSANMDIGEVKKKYGNKICLVGNIDCSHLLTWGNPREVEQAVRECIEKAATGGGLIISSSNSIHSSVNPQNYLAMIQTVNRFGKYRT